MLLKLLRKLTVDVSNLSEYTTVALRVNYYILCLYMCSNNLFQYYFTLNLFSFSFSLYTMTVVPDIMAHLEDKVVDRAMKKKD